MSEATHATHSTPPTIIALAAVRQNCRARTRSDQVENFEEGARVLPFAKTARRRSKAGAAPAQERRRRAERGDDDWYLRFGARLRALRLAAGVSEQDAAAAAGRSVETWRSYERTGKGRLLFAVIRFADRYGISYPDLWEF